MIKIVLIDRPGDYRLTVAGDVGLIRQVLTVGEVKFRSFDNLPVVSINYPSIEVISKVVLLFADKKPKIDKKITTLLQGEHFKCYVFPKGLPLSKNQQALIRKIFRKNLLLINDDSGTGKTHTLLGLILGSKMTVTYIAPIDVLYQIKRILSRYYKDAVYNMAMERVNFLPLTKDLASAPSADILVIDEVHRVMTKKQLLKSLSKQTYKIRILMAPKSRMYNQDKKIILRLLGLNLSNDPERLIQEHSHYGEQSSHPQVRPIIVTSNQSPFLEMKRKFLGRVDKESFERFRSELSMERYLGIKPFIKKKLFENTTIAIITSSEKTKDAILENFPMFKKYTLGEDSRYVIFDPENSPDGIELDHTEVISLESYPAASLPAAFVYRFYRKALGDRIQSFYSARTDHPFDQFFVESQAFSSIKNQIQYLNEKLQLSQKAS